MPFGKRRPGLRDLPRSILGGIQLHSQDFADTTMPGARKMDLHHLYIEPRQTPLGQLKAAAPAGAVPSGTAAAVNILHFPSQGTLEMSQIGTQTAILPPIAASGLEVSGDPAVGEGREFCSGLMAICPGCFVIGQDAAFFMRVRYEVSAVAGLSDCAVGFRKNDAYAPLIDDYTEMAVVNLISGQLTIETILGNAATVTTSLGPGNVVPNNCVVECRVDVSAAGAVTYSAGSVATVLGIPPVAAPQPLAPAYTFSGAGAPTVVPFWYFVNAGAGVSSLKLKVFESGYRQGTA